MHRFNYILIIFLCFALVGCKERQEYRDALSRAEAVMEDYPDSALVILDSLGTYLSDFDHRFQMQYQLQLATAHTKLGEVFTTDSLTKSLVDYFDKHGTDDEKALSYYLYGCSLVDLGQAPEGLQAYYTALEHVDTTKTDCNYRLLKSIYGQMSTIFDAQNLPQDEIWALNHYIENVKRTSSEGDYIYAKFRMASPYYLLNEVDTILQIIRTSDAELISIGETQKAAIVQGTAIHFYVEKGQLGDAKRSIDIYENESGLFDENGEIKKGCESYYCYRGEYELAVNHLDAAEKYFRKANQYDYLSGGYKGLLNVYRKRNNVDSVYHFSLLYEEAQDALHNQMRTTAIHQMSALYNYNRSQQEAEQEREKSRRLKMYFLCIAILASVSFCVLWWLYHRHQKKKKIEFAKLNKRLQNALMARSEISAELQMLKSKDYDSIIAEKENEENELREEIERLNHEIGKYQQAKENEPVDNLDAFLSCDIAQLFLKKANLKTERPQATEREWSLLETQFCKCLPVLAKSFTEGTPLSPLQQHVCILILLGIPDATIRMMLGSSKSVFSDTKSRSNTKLFGQNEARSLKNNLFQAIKLS